MQPLVSIIVPVYNCEKSLQKCAESILSQTLKNLELILVDDGSPDSSPAKADAIAEGDGRVVVIHKENGGPSSARNCGIDNARGEYIQFVDSDDYIDPDMTESLYNAIIKNGTDLAACGFIKVRAEDEERVVFPELDFVKRDEMTEKIPNFVRSFFPNSPCNKLYKKSLINHRFIEGISLAEDLLFNLEYLKNTEAISVLGSCPYHYIMDNTASLTGRVRISRVTDTLNTYCESIAFYEKHGRAEDIAETSYLNASVILYSTLDLLRGSFYSEKEKKAFVKETLRDERVALIFKNCNSLSKKQKLLAFFIKKRCYTVLKLFSKL